MLDSPLGDHVPHAATHDLADRYNYLTIVALLYVLRLDMRVDQVKLPLPIVTNLPVMKASTLHPIWPIQVRVRRREAPSMSRVLNAS